MLELSENRPSHLIHNRLSYHPLVYCVLPTNILNLSTSCPGAICFNKDLEKRRTTDKGQGLPNIIGAHYPLTLNKKFG